MRARSDAHVCILWIWELVVSCFCAVLGADSVCIFDFFNCFFRDFRRAQTRIFCDSMLYGNDGTRRSDRSARNSRRRSNLSSSAAPRVAQRRRHGRQVSFRRAHAARRAFRARRARICALPSAARGPRLRVQARLPCARIRAAPAAPAVPPRRHAAQCAALPVVARVVTERGALAFSWSLTLLCLCFVCVVRLFRTELCHYSGFRIYPGHGRKFIRTDGRQYIFINRKSERSFLMKRKAAKHSWTQLYRRLHKKGIQEEAQRRRNRRKVSAAPKAVEGASLEVIKAKRNQRPEVRKAAREAALKDIKERKAKAKSARPAHVKGSNKMPVAQRR